MATWLLIEFSGRAATAFYPLKLHFDMGTAKYIYLKRVTQGLIGRIAIFFEKLITENKLKIVVVVATSICEVVTTSPTLVY